MTQTTWTNAALAAIYDELAHLTALREENNQAFRVRAYETAAQTIRTAEETVGTLDLAALQTLHGIGPTIAGKIRELIDNGKMDKLERLRAAFPPSVIALSRLPGIGPKRLSQMRTILGIESIDALKAALEAGQLNELPRFGAKTAAKLQDALTRLGQHAGTERRWPRAHITPLADHLVSVFQDLVEVEAACACGSLRRGEPTIGDLDIVCGSTTPENVMRVFLTRPEAAQVLVSGDTKTSVVTEDGFQIDLRVVEPSVYGATMLYFTGSKQHNVQLRQRALSQGMTLNEYGLFRLEANGERGALVASETETEIYAALGLDYIPPEARVGAGEAA
ncbi:MAG: DNA polymerase (family 10) [Myxococcota bacterium]|jgi:DNA polymerase (family 10)